MCCVLAVAIVVTRNKELLFIINITPYIYIDIISSVESHYKIKNLKYLNYS